jgi:hypothetical protein
MKHRTPKPVKRRKKYVFTVADLIQWTEFCAQVDCDEGNHEDAARYMAINRNLRKVAQKRGAKL